MKWVVRVTHEDDQGRCTTAQYAITEELLKDMPPDFRTYIFEKMVKQIEAKLKEKNT